MGGWSQAQVGDVPLFPAPKNPRRSIRLDLVQKWLLRAEQLAELPRLRGGIWHPYRRLWASERKHMPDIDVAAAGGWKDTPANRLTSVVKKKETTFPGCNAEVTK